MNLALRIKKIYSNQSMTRILLNESFEGIKINGNVLDVGGARNPDYFEYFDIGDLKKRIIIDGKTHNIDFEKDILPFDSHSFDTIICANVLEHIFNHNHLVSEIYRLLKNDGILVGFVPFLIQYHPDPRDYFRYTEEALKEIFNRHGFRTIDIKGVGLGPIAVNFNNIMFIFPRIIRCFMFVYYFVLAKISIRLKPSLLGRYPLGFTFVCKK